MQLEAVQESRESVLHITDGQADALVALGRALASKSDWWGATADISDRTVVSCRRLGGGWGVTVRDAVGVISVDGLQIEVAPKIPLAHLLHFIDLSGPEPRTNSSAVSTSHGRSLWEVLGRWFVEASEATVRLGLVRDYEERAEILPHLEGRVDVVATTMNYYSGRIEFACEFETFDEDTPLNRVLKAAARLVRGGRLFSQDLRRRAARLVSQMPDVGDLRRRDLSLTFDRRSGHYRRAAGLGLLLIRSTHLSPTHGATAGSAFLLRTPDAVEEGIRQVIQRALSNLAVVRKKAIALSPSSLTLNPDLVIGDYAIGDVKYTIVGSEWVRSHMYQLVAFAEGFRVSEALLVSFSRDACPKPIRVGDIDLSAVVWPADPALAVDEALRIFEHQLLSWAA